MKTTKRILTLVLALAVSSVAFSQVLVKSLTISPADIDAFKAANGIDLRNKPNGLFYRLREEVTIDGLNAPVGMSGLECYITDKTDKGYVALFRNPTGADSYRFIVLTYDQKKKVTGTYDLCTLTGNNYCEVQDIRWFDNHLYFNMACPTYSSAIEGRGSKLYDLDLNTGEINWSSKYLTSNDIFLVDKNFVYCGYGFTDEEDFIYLLDRRYGTTLTACPLYSKHEYMQFIGDYTLFVQDYQDNGYVFCVNEKGVRVTGSGVRFRTGPTTASALLVDSEGRTIHPLKGDVLPFWGDEGDFFKVIYNQVNYVYISRRYATTDAMPTFDSCDLTDAGVRAWLGRGEDDDKAYIEIYDLEKFAAYANVPVENLELGVGVYSVAIDSPVACGVFLGKAYERLGLFIESEDCRAFGCDLTYAARTGLLYSVEFDEDFLGVDRDCVDGFVSETEHFDYGPTYPVVRARFLNGLKSDPLFFGEGDDEEDYDYEEPFVYEQKFHTDCTLEDSVGSKTSVTLDFETHASGLAGGTITYHRKKGKDSVIRLLGSANAAYELDGPHNFVHLTEYLKDGQICGEMDLDVFGSTIVGGTWTMDDRRLTMAFDELENYDDFQTSEIFNPADDNEVSGTYVWTRKVKGHPILSEYNGTFTLKCEGDSVSYSGCVVMPNTAQVEGKAALIAPKMFIFSPAECGDDITYYVYIYHDALYVEVMPEDAEAECFGKGAILTGWYLRKK